MQAFAFRGGSEVGPDFIKGEMPAETETR